MRMHFYSAAAEHDEEGFLSEEQFLELLGEVHELNLWWARANSGLKQRFGRVSDSAVRTPELRRQMMSHPGYRLLWIKSDDGLLDAYVDWFLGSMPSMDGDEEFHEGGEAFFAGFNENGLSFGKVAYLYYAVTEYHSQGKGFARMLLREMLQKAEAEAEAVVTDLPLKPYCGRIIGICEELGFVPTPRIVDDEAGNEWRQYARPLAKKTLLMQGDFAIGVR